MMDLPGQHEDRSRMPERTVHIVVLVESSVWRVLWSWVRGCEIVLLKTEPSTVLMRKALLFIERMLCRSSRVSRFEDGADEDYLAIREEWTFVYPDFFSRLEPEIEQRFNFDKIDITLGLMP